jgi:plastocyanin domain-containing protein
MSQTTFVQKASMVVVVVCLLLAGYLVLKPKPSASQNVSTSLAPVVDGKQKISMEVLANSYSPNYFKIKAGVPVAWEIISSGQPGCGSGAVVSNLLPGGVVYLNPARGQITKTEFTAPKPGIYSFSCTMNMIRGTIEVIN